MIMKKLNVLFLAFALIGWISFTSCGNNSRTNDADAIENPNDNIMGDQGDNSEYDDEVEDLRDDIRDAQKDIDDRISELRKKMDDATAETKVEINQKIEKLEAKRVQLSADMDRLGEDMGDGWETFKMNVRKTLDELGDDIDDNM